MTSNIAVTPREETVEEFLARGGSNESKLIPILPAAFCFAANVSTSSNPLPAFSTRPSTETPIREVHDEIQP